MRRLALVVLLLVGCAVAAGILDTAQKVQAELHAWIECAQPSISPGQCALSGLISGWLVGEGWIDRDDLADAEKLSAAVRIALEFLDALLGTRADYTIEEVDGALVFSGRGAEVARDEVARRHRLRAAVATEIEFRRLEAFVAEAARRRIVE